MRHGLEWFIHLRAQWPRVGDKLPAYAPAGAWLLYLTLPFISRPISLDSVAFSQDLSSWL